MVDYWSYPTNYTNGTGVNSTADFFLNYPAYITSGLSTTMIMVFVFLVFFALSLPFGVGSALVASSFISFILSTYLWWNGVLGASGIIYPMIFFSLTIVSAIIVGNSRN